MQNAISQGSTVDLDHVGFIIPDLSAARALFEALGFTLTSRADHTRRDSEGRVVPAGSSQHSVMLGTGYVELMQITDPEAGHQLTPAMRERFGLHVLALGTADAAACHADRVRAGLRVGPVMDWSRPVTTPERSGTARFLYFDTPWQPGAPSYLCWVHHATPELVRSPSLVRHGNGAVSLRGVHYVGPEAGLGAWATQLQQAGAGAPAPGPGAAQLRLALGSCWLELLADDAEPCVRPSGLTFGLVEPQAIAEAARRVGLPVRMAQDAVTVVLGAPYGLMLHAVREPAG
jgi:catechol 2,3-dioxygenase-like lactoylglutathione lyase family enzyme